VLLKTLNKLAKCEISREEVLELAEAEVHSTCELEATPSPEKPKRKKKQKVKTPNVKKPNVKKPKVTKDVDISTAKRQAKELFGKSDSESDIEKKKPRLSEKAVRIAPARNRMKEMLRTKPYVTSDSESDSDSDVMELQREIAQLKKQLQSRSTSHLDPVFGKLASACQLYVSLIDFLSEQLLALEIN